MPPLLHPHRRNATAAMAAIGRVVRVLIATSVAPVPVRAQVGKPHHFRGAQGIQGRSSAVARMVVGPVVCPLLIGRTNELQELVARRLAASKGHGSLVLVSGESGIGKSRLVSALREELVGRRVHVGVGYARESGGAPYAPIVEAARMAGLSLEIPAAASQGEQVAALAAYIAGAARRRNSVLILEDLHCADAATFDLISYMLPSLPSLPLLVVATYRTDVPFDAHTSASLGRLERHCASSIALEPLSEIEMRRLLRVTIGDGYHLGPEEIGEIVRRAEGNPFFAEELLKSAVVRGWRDRRSSLPLTIRASVEERLSELDEETLRIAQHAALFSRTIVSPLLAQLCEATGVDVSSALRRMRDLRLVDEIAGDPDAFCFRHALLRDVVHESMLAQEAIALHARLLQLLETRPGSSVYDLAYHASASGDADRCVFYNERAGDEAAAVHAYLDASACYERAIREAQTQTTRLRLLCKRAEVCARVGKATPAADLYAQAADAAARTGDEMRALELRGLCAVQARLAGDNERAVAILSRAIDATPDTARHLRATLSLDLAFCKADVADIAAATALIERSAHAAAPCAYWRAATYAAAVRGDVDAVRAHAAQEIAHSRPLGRVETLRVRFNLAFNLCALGYDRDALSVFDAILPDLRELHLWSREMLSCANAAFIHLRRGNFATARELIARGIALPELSTTGPIALAAAALTLANVSGDAAAIAGALSQEVVDAAFHSGIDSTLGRFAGPYARWLYSQHRYEECRATLARAVQLLHGVFGSTETLLAAVELGDEPTMQRALALAAQAQNVQHVPLYAATLAHVRALAAARGESEDAGARAAEAERWYEMLGWPMHAARCAELRGERKARSTYRRLRATGERRRAIDLSPREMEVARMIASGAPNKLIADRCNVSLRTVEKHLTSIYAKLGLRNRAELVALVAAYRGDAAHQARPVAFPANPRPSANLFPR